MNRNQLPNPAGLPAPAPAIFPGPVAAHALRKSNFLTVNFPVASRNLISCHQNFLWPQEISFWMATGFGPVRKSNFLTPNVPVASQNLISCHQNFLCPQEIFFSVTKFSCGLRKSNFLWRFVRLFAENSIFRLWATVFASKPRTLNPLTP